MYNTNIHIYIYIYIYIYIHTYISLWRTAGQTSPGYSVPTENYAAPEASYFIRSCDCGSSLPPDQWHGLSDTFSTFIFVSICESNLTWTEFQPWVAGPTQIWSGKVARRAACHARVDR